MSKQSEKKQPINSSPQQLESQTRELIESRFTIIKLQERLTLLTHENLQLVRERDEIRQLETESAEEFNIKNSTNERRLSDLRGLNTKLEIENKQLEARLKVLEKTFNDQQTQKGREFEDYRKSVQTQISKLENQLVDYKLYMSERNQLEADRLNLMERVELEKADRIREVADKEREKIQALDQLRDQSSHQIRDIRSSLLCLKKQQLSYTTRLTTIQNHQLISEIEYQSRETEKLLSKNHDYQKKISELQQELQTQKEMSEEFAKRTLFSKGVIKKLNTRVQQLTEEIEMLKNTQCVQPVENNDTNDQTEAVLLALNNELEQKQKALMQLTQKLSQVELEKNKLATENTFYEKRINKLCSVLLRHFDDVLKGGVPKDDEARDSEINFDRIREMPVQKWSQEELTSVVEMLLNLIRPCLKKNSFLLPYLKKSLGEQDGSKRTSSDSRLEKLNLGLSSSLNKEFTGTERCNSSIPTIFDNSKMKKGLLGQLSTRMSSTIVVSKLRDWGRPVQDTSVHKKRTRIAQRMLSNL